MIRFGSLFAGIGGIDLGLERAGMSCAWQVENDPYAAAVLRKHWPDVRRWDDVRTFPPDDGTDWAVDLICGGFPCQPVSLAGKRKAQDDARWLWPEFARIIRTLRPRYALMENVPGLFVRGMGDVLGDLAACGYDCEWTSIPAAAVGAPHLRWREFIISHRDSERFQTSERTVTSETVKSRCKDTLANSSINGRIARRAGDSMQGPQRRQSNRSRILTAHAYRESARRFTESWGERGQWTTEPDVGRVAHGIPSRVDRLRCLGNAVVPQVAEVVGRMIVEADCQ